MPVPGDHQRRETKPEIWVPVDPPAPDDPPIPAAQSPVLDVVGQPFELAPGIDLDLKVTPTKTLLELARLDTMVSLHPARPADASSPLPRESRHYEVALGWLDRFGYLTTEQLRRAILPWGSSEWIQKVLRDLLRAGLVERRRPQLRTGGGRRRGGQAPWMWSLTAAGLRQGKAWSIPADKLLWNALCAPQIPEWRRWRRSEAHAGASLRHDLHAADWAVALCQFAADWNTFAVIDVFTPRYPQGSLSPPAKLPIAGARPHGTWLYEVPLDRDWIFDGISSGPFARTIKPDLTLRLWLWLDDRDGCEVDLLVEVDRTGRRAKNLRKLVAYDEFLTGWGLLHPRVERYGRPVVIFVCPDKQLMHSLMEAADRLVVGRIGQLGMPDRQWRYPGREHLLFTTEEHIHHGSLLAWRLPALPPDVRRAADGDAMSAQLVTILPEYVIPEKSSSPWGA